MPTFSDFLPVIATTPPRIKLTGWGTPDWVFLRWDIDGYTLSLDYNAGCDRPDERVLESLCEAYLFPVFQPGEERILGNSDSRVELVFDDDMLEEIERVMRPFLAAIEPLVVEATPYSARPEAWGGPKHDTEDEELDESEAAFLDLLDRDIADNPERLVPLTSDLLAEINDVLGDELPTDAD